MAINPGRLLPVIGMMVAIFVVSAQPGDQLPLPELLNFDKAWHLLEYGVLAATAFYALHPVPGQARTSAALGVVCFAALYGASDEFHQSFVRLRTATITDVIADTLGALLVAALWWWRSRSR